MLSIFIQVIEALLGCSALLALLTACGGERGNGEQGTGNRERRGIGDGEWGMDVLIRTTRISPGNLPNTSKKNPIPHSPFPIPNSLLRRSCVAGLAGALVLAALRRNTALINLGIWSAWAMAAALAAEGVILTLFWRRMGNGEWGVGSGCFDSNDQNIARQSSRYLKQKPHPPSPIPHPLLAAALLFYSLPPVFLLPADFVLAGEGFFNTAFLFKCAGYAAGLLVVFIMALALHTIAKKLSRLQFGIFFTAITTIIALQQLTAVIRLLFARRVIPMNRALFRVITLAVNNEIVFSFAVLAVMMILVVLCYLVLGNGEWGMGDGCFDSNNQNIARQSSQYLKEETYSLLPTPATVPVPRSPFPFFPHPPSPIPHPLLPANPAEKRKQKAALRNRRRWCAAAGALCVLSFLSLTVLKRISEQAVKLSPAEAMTIAGGEIIIPSAQVEDGHLHRFALSASDGTEVRFIVVKKSASAYGVGLDACDICGATGYYERKDGIVCRLCDVVMNKSTIGFKGGCNPVPLAYTMRGGSMVILTDDLEKEKGRFAP